MVAACQQTSEYQQMVERESLRTDTVNTLFLNYELGMSRQAFFDSSWALNRRGLVSHGPNNRNVQLKLPDEFHHESTMLYYPDFVDDLVAQMRVRFSYDGWAPWNRHLWADSLIFDVHDLMEDWYGSGFILQERSTPTMDTTPEFIKIDANRHITIQRDSDREVLVKITDIRAMPPKEDE
ncbi:MAG: hypothetical protein OXF06_00805 [Bacteroidetes bacterium]|nr:hypothetical protein [Bacteroidota bacterium]MCY4223350.1 hypothetical protein [Bacteroidota bacterium]